MYNNNVILLEFDDRLIYQKHYNCLYSFLNNNLDYDNFRKQLLTMHTKITKEIQQDGNYNFHKIIEHQNKFNFVPWTLPWIEFINEEFIASIAPTIKIIENKEEFVFTKSFYLFVENQEIKNNIFNFLKKKSVENPQIYADVMESYYFYKTDKFERVISFCIIMDIKDNLILKIDIHQFLAIFGDNSEKSLMKQKNFYYFYRTLEGIREDISHSINQIDNKNLIRNIVISNLKKYAMFCI